MPIPLLAVAAVKLWASRALMGAGLTWLTTETGILTLWTDLKKAAVNEAFEKAGLVLDDDEPWSDASLSNAMTLRTGVTIRSLKNRAMVEEDIESFALDKIAAKTGYQITTLRDIDRLKFDMMVIGLAIVQQRTGIPITPFQFGADWVEPLKSDLTDWARASIMAEMGGQVSNIVAQMSEMEDLEALAVTLNQRLSSSDSVREFTAKGLAVGIAEKLVSESVSRFEVTAAGSGKKGRRALQLREAQRRFRAKWGNRSEYLPVVP